MCKDWRRLSVPSSDWSLPTFRIAPTCPPGCYSFSPRSYCALRPIDHADQDPHHRPLEEVSRRLLERQCQPDVQVHVVVQDECANGENSDERAETCTLGGAGTT